MTGRLVLGLLVAVVLALGSVALSIGQPSEDTAERHIRVQDAAPELKSILSVFERPQAPSEALPEELAAELEASKEARPGENPTEARRIDLPTGPVHLWPTEDGVCSSWGSCVPVREIQGEGVVVGDSTTGSGETYKRLVVSGVVRDGIDEVTVTFVDGRQAAIPVRENVFVVEMTDVGAHAIPRKLSWIDATGAHSKLIGIEAPNVPAERLRKAIEQAEAEASP